MIAVTKGCENREEAVRLISMVKEKDLEAASKLYDQYAPVLYGYLLTKINDQSIAEEILTCTFLSIWKNSFAFDASQSRPLIWMMQLCKMELELYVKEQNNSR